MDTDRSERGTFHDPAPLRPARTVLHKRVATERDRIGGVSRRRSTTMAASRAAIPTQQEEIMSNAAISMDGQAAVTPTTLSWKFIHWGLGLFITGFLVGFV